MDSLERFLSNQAQEESAFLESLESPQKPVFDHNQSDRKKTTTTTRTDTAEECTFADKLGLDAREQQFDVAKSRQRFDATLQNTLHNCIIDRTPKKTRTTKKSDDGGDSLLHRIESYKKVKQNKNLSRDYTQPRETKIHKTPRPWQAGKFGKAWNFNTPNAFQPRDPRFMKDPESQRSGGGSGGRTQSGGWQFRNAYKFLDDIIDRDIGMIEERVQNTKEEIRNAKKQTTTRNKRTELDIKRKDAALRTLKQELIALQNKKQRITEKDLEQKSKSEARKLELEQIRSGNKKPFHHNLKKTRFGQVKWNKNSNQSNNQNDNDGATTGGDDSSGIDIQKIYLQQKYDKLKNDGKLEKYMRKKTQRINTKFRSALAKKSGRGWNESG